MTAEIESFTAAYVIFCKKGKKYCRDVVAGRQKEKFLAKK